MIGEPPFTVGIEEEYLLVDPESRKLIREAPDSLLTRCQELIGPQATPEFLQSQIEIGTRVCKSIREAREDLGRLRSAVHQIAGEHDLGMLAAASHPFAAWSEQIHTDKERYHVLAQDLQEVARRLVICGMHVHVGIDDDNLRIDLMNQATYVLPHLLALSTSSPFWEGHPTGLMSYRVAVWDELPRTGIPEQFDSYDEYHRHVAALVKTGLIEDGSKIWWDVRPSARFPTLELRIPDVCTRMEDAVCIAALYLCWLRMLYRLRRENQRWRRYSTMLISENRWLAQRYGFEHGLVDFGLGELIPYSELLEEILDLIAEDAEHFECTAEVEHAQTILSRGTSAHWQLKTYHQERANGASVNEALVAVVDMLRRETQHGL